MEGHIQVRVSVTARAKNRWSHTNRNIEILENGDLGLQTCPTFRTMALVHRSQGHGPGTLWSGAQPSYTVVRGAALVHCGQEHGPVIL